MLAPDRLIRTRQPDRAPPSVEGRQASPRELDARHARHGGSAECRQGAAADKLPQAEIVQNQVACITPRGATFSRTAFCLSEALEPEAKAHVARLLNQRKRLRKGETLFRLGGTFHALFAICAGSCKTVLMTRGGQQQVAGYYMAGEIIGLDGMGTGAHECQAAALEDMEVCPLPCKEIEHLARVSEAFRHNLHKLLSRDGVRAQNRMLVLGTMRAEQRLAVFLLDLSQRFRARGYSPCEYVLRMTRDEIGSYLGLALETVSREFSRFQRHGLIQVQGRTVKLLDAVAVSRLVES